MAIRYKVDILAELKKKGYSSTRIREEKLIGQSYLQQLRTMVNWYHGKLWILSALFWSASPGICLSSRRKKQQNKKWRDGLRLSLLRHYELIAISSALSIS